MSTVVAEEDEAARFEGLRQRGTVQTGLTVWSMRGSSEGAYERQYLVVWTINIRAYSMNIMHSLCPLVRVKRTEDEHEHDDVGRGGGEIRW